MTVKDLNEGLNHLDPELIEEFTARQDAYKQKKRARAYWVAAVAAILVLAIGIGMLSSINLGSGNLLAAPEYPKMAGYVDRYDLFKQEKPEDIDAYYEAMLKYKDACKEQYDQPDGYADSLTGFFQTSIAQFLQRDGNPTYSPLNVYMAMAMLAETAGGNSRQQILDLFGLETIAQLRQQASYVWNAHYSDDGRTTVLLANSLWLNDAYTFKQAAANRLAEHYYASSYKGNLGSAEMNRLLQNWLNENTGGLLKDQANNIKLDPSTAFAIASTVYFKADWEEEFSPKATKDAVFHSPDRDITTPFMNQIFTGMPYYRGQNFGAVFLELSGENGMWLILPDEGCSTADILAGDEYLQMTLDPKSWENQKRYFVHLSVPKFDVASQTDLVAGMKALGVTDIFDPAVSNFTPLSYARSLAVNEINHAARVVIDEKGCTAGAFTALGLIGGNPSYKRIDFVLDRPFLFLVSSRDNLPLFAGIVNKP